MALLAARVLKHGYCAVDGQGEELEIRPSWRGFLEVNFPQDEGTVTTMYKKTTVQRFSPLVSALAAAAVAAYMIKRRKEMAE